MDGTAVAAAAVLTSVFALALVTVKLRSTQKRRERYGNGSLVLRCGTRKSALAMFQTRWSASFLVEKHEGISVVILDGVDTVADKTLNVSLKELVKKEVKDTLKPSPGLFTKELEDGLMKNKYDFVVHSLKDVPTTLPAGLTIAAICEREDPRDCVVFNKASIKHLNELSSGSIVGTSSVRREALLKRDYPHLRLKLIRGNVNTRLSKLESGEYDAIILAFAGMKRLGFSDRIGQVLDSKTFPYGVGQGSLAIECREADHDYCKILKSISHKESMFRCQSERALLKELEGGCQVPLGVSSQVYYSKVKEEDVIEISCQILSLDGRCTVSGQLSGPAVDCIQIGVSLAKRLREQGGGRALIRADDSWSDHQDLSKPTNRRPITYGSAEEPARFQM